MLMKIDMQGLSRPLQIHPKILKIHNDRLFIAYEKLSNYTSTVPINIGYEPVINEHK